MENSERRRWGVGISGFTLIAVLALVGIFCGNTAKTGNLIVTANGEDFVRQGFITRDGWSVTFDSVLVHLSDIRAYNKEQGLQQKLSGAYLVDVAAGGKNAAPIPVDTLNAIPAGNYQSLQFRISRSTSGTFEGYSMVLKGTASKDGDSLPFLIQLDEEMLFTGDEGYVGDEIKGVVAPDSTGEVEITFHFDHIFGDAGADSTDHINTGSVGFDYFKPYIQKNNGVVSQAELISTQDYKKFVQSLRSLGHLGEGHCHVSETSTKY